MKGWIPRTTEEGNVFWYGDARKDGKVSYWFRWVHLFCYVLVDEILEGV